MEEMNILIVEEDEHFRKLICKILSNEGFIVHQTSNNSETIKIINQTNIDLIIIDVSTNTDESYNIVREIRNYNLKILIVCLSSQNNNIDIIQGLNSGIDSYIPKPINLSVLCARITSLLKRRKEILDNNTFGHFIIHEPFKFDLDSYKFYKNNSELKLSSKETKLIKFFMEHPNTVLSKEELYENIWSSNKIDENSIMVYMKYLRNKIENTPRNPKYIKTIWGIGYKFSV